jgi:hypothetical protein
VSYRVTALVVAVACIGLVVAQDVVPLVDFFHTWQYATALALGGFLLVAYANGARRGQDGALGKRLALAVLGALIVTLTGIASGLLGPDTQTVSHPPGTVAPIPDLRAAAFFAPADAASIAAGTAHVVVRRPQHTDIDVAPNERKFVGSSVLLLQMSPAAFVEARDARGNRLTVTQPTNPSFLSPVLLFPNTQVISGKKLPFDTFAVPALERVVKTVFLPGSMTSSLHVPPADAGKPAVLFAVDDDRGQSHGITIDPDGAEVPIAGMRLRATIGSYPALVVASAPQPLALAGGIALFLAGIVWSALAWLPGRAPLRNPSSS